jgi:translation initiation factor 3 subunit I
MLLATSGDGAKIFDPESLELVKTFKTEVPMNAGAISPLIYDKKNPKFHAIVAGGVQARDAAKHRVYIVEF